MVSSINNHKHPVGKYILSSVSERSLVKSWTISTCCGSVLFLRSCHYFWAQNFSIFLFCENFLRIFGVLLFFMFYFFLICIAFTWFPFCENFSWFPFCENFLGILELSCFLFCATTRPRRGSFSVEKNIDERAKGLRKQRKLQLFF
jgi:hypothetical protein